jgi:hypothetical protein
MIGVVNASLIKKLGNLLLMDPAGNFVSIVRRIF